jgi:hypothetical protein
VRSPKGACRGRNRGSQKIKKKKRIDILLPTNFNFLKVLKHVADFLNLQFC